MKTAPPRARSKDCGSGVGQELCRGLVGEPKTQGTQSSGKLGGAEGPKSPRGTESEAKRQNPGVWDTQMDGSCPENGHKDE